MPNDPLLLARLQMAFTLGVHIVLACLGVGLPVLLLAAEGLGLRRGDPAWTALARRWSKAFAVLFALGAVSGTVLSFELGVLWPGLMGRFGAVFGLPFTLESFAFFLEAIFAGIYLYGWDRLSPRAHWWTGVPILLSGLASAAFVTCANAWMNSPTGFRLDESGNLVDAQPWAALWGPAAPTQVLHMLLAAYLVTGFLVAARHAWPLLRLGSAAHRDHRRGLVLGLALGSVAAPLQALSGHAAAEMVAREQPVKLAAMEGQWRTETRAPLRIGGWPDEQAEVTRYAIEIPGALSLLAFGDLDAEVAGLDQVAPEDRPPVAIVHLAFQLMVGLGTGLIALAAWAGYRGLRRRSWSDHRPLLYACLAAGPASVLAMEAGWTVTEVGRQPWIVQGYMRTSEAVGDAPGLPWIFAGTVVLYAALSVAAALVLVRMGQAAEEGEHAA